MFIYLEVHNFLSFGYTFFDLRETNTKSKKFVALYGENGSGKTNIVTAYYLLSRSLSSIQTFEDELEIKELLESKDKKIPIDLLELINMNKFDKFLMSCRMINAIEPTRIKYGFILNGVEGYYEIAFTDHIISEELYYKGKQNRTTLFSISENNEYISIGFSPSFISDKQYENEIKDNIIKYWGKHTLLSIIDNEFTQKNKQYILSQLSESFLKVFSFFHELTIVCKTSNHLSRGTTVKRFNSVLRNIEYGSIDKKDLEKIKFTEAILDNFFTQAYADIKSVRYKIENDKDKLIYSLQFEKMIAGKVRIIDFQNESAGTQNILSIFEALIGVLFGGIVIYDEIDNGIHDLLLSCILKSLSNNITGQLIITTHNTSLLEDISPNNAYVIDVDYLGKKEINCLSDYGIRENDNHNTRLMYLKHSFGGTPFADYIDFSKIHNLLENKQGENNEQDEESY